MEAEAEVPSKFIASKMLIKTETCSLSENASFFKDLQTHELTDTDAITHRYCCC